MGLYDVVESEDQDMEIKHDPHQIEETLRWNTPEYDRTPALQRSMFLTLAQMCIW